MLRGPLTSLRQMFFHHQRAVAQPNARFGPSPRCNGGPPHLRNKGPRSSSGLPPDGVTMLLRSPLAIAALALASMPLMHFAQASKPDVDAFIQRWDADHDEAISRDELRNATGDRLDPLIDKMFHAIDRNHDGKLNKHEHHRRESLLAI